MMKHQTHNIIGTPFVDIQRRDQIIGSAADRHLVVVLTHYGSAGWQTCRSRFIDCRIDEQRIFIERPTGDAPETPSLSVGEQIGVSFRRGRTKCLFTTVVTGCGRAVDDRAESIDTITLRWPENLQEMQRRAYERVSPPRQEHIEVAYWPTVSHGDVSVSSRMSGSCVHPARRATGAAETPPDARRGKLDNLSAGGLSLTVDDKLTASIGDNMCCSFQPAPKTEILTFDAKVRHLAQTDRNQWSLGLQFIGLETSTEGQCRLAQLAIIVSRFRRASVPGAR